MVEFLSASELSERGPGFYHRNPCLQPWSPVPVSFLQVLLPKFRIEIQLFYNAVVFIPMMIGMYYQMFRPKEEESTTCTCSWQ